MELKIIILIIALISLNEGKIFEKCELVKELHRQGIPESELSDWLCLVEGESSLNTLAMNPEKNTDGSWDWGLFQINDRYWCDGGKETKNACNINCKELAKDDITEAVKCARIIKEEQGFSAWVAWNNRCKGKELPNAEKCL